MGGSDTDLPHSRGGSSSKTSSKASTRSRRSHQAGGADHPDSGVSASGVRQQRSFNEQDEDAQTARLPRAALKYPPNDLNNNSVLAGAADAAGRGRRAPPNTTKRSRSSSDVRAVTVAMSNLSHSGACGGSRGGVTARHQGSAGGPGSCRGGSVGNASGGGGGPPTGPPIVFRPPRRSWQAQRCEMIYVPLRQTHWFADRGGGTPSLFTRDALPRVCEQVAADGNCLFRALSFWISGSEEFHWQDDGLDPPLLQVRCYMMEQMARHPDPYKVVVADEKVEEYLTESRMRDEGVWGTDVEIFVAATLLGTPIAVYAAFGDQFLWHVFKPLEESSVLMAHNYMLYLINSNNHFEPVIDV